MNEMDERRDVIATFIYPRVPNVGCRTVALPLAVWQRQHVFGTFGTRSFFWLAGAPNSGLFTPVFGRPGKLLVSSDWDRSPIDDKCCFI